jgi:hypothetical protein
MKRRLTIVLGWLIVVSLVLACGVSTPVATTSIPASTNTTVPTDTPEPTVAPTATPDLAATQTAEAEAALKAKEADAKEKMDSLDIVSDPGSLKWVQSESVVVKNTGYWQFAYAPLVDGIEAENFVFKTEITWEATSLVYCGFVFRSATEDPEKIDKSIHYKFYFMRFSGLPYWEIAAFKRNGAFSHFITGDKARFAGALNMDNGGTNEIVFVARGNEFTVFINGERQSRFFDDSNISSKGYFAGLSDQDTGSSSCTFENGWLWILE